MPQGVEISARVARETSSGSGRSAVSQAGAPQGVQAEVPQGGSVQGCRLRASGSTATEQVNLGASTSGVSPHEEAFRAVLFADVVQEFADDDAMSSASGTRVLGLRAITMSSVFCTSCVLLRLRSLPM